MVRHDNLYASTEGRAFWALDDLSAVRQVADSVVKKIAHLFAPRPALQVPGGNPPVRDAGRNAPPGANIYYHLASAPDTNTVLTIEFLDARGAVVRTYSSKVATGAAAAAGGRRAGAGSNRLSPKAGLNAMQWDLRGEAPTQLEGISMFGGPSGGALVTPGRYSVRLRYGTVTQTQSLDVQPDPRATHDAAEIAARDSLSRAIVDRVKDIHDAVLRLRDIKDQVQKIVDRTKDAEQAKEIGEKGKGITGKVDLVDPKLTTKSRNGQDIINYRNGINAQYVFLLGNLEGNDVVTQPMRDRFADLEKLWKALKADVDTIELQDVPAFNKLLQDAKVPGVIVPAPKPKVAM
jgi:soluble cytochrome b562